MAIASKKTAKKRSGKKARKLGHATTKAAAAKKRAKKTIRVKKGNAAKKTSATKKASKRPAKKSPKKAQLATGRLTSNKPSVSRRRSGAKTAKGRTQPASLPGSPVASERKSFYITTAIAYPNGVPHIGHAYEAIATDALARFQRLDGADVFFLTGTDEHGLKMVQTAEFEKLPTIEVATRNAQRFKDMDERLNVSFDRFIRTTEQQHHRSSQEILEADGRQWRHLPR